MQKPDADPSGFIISEVIWQNKCTILLELIAETLLMAQGCDFCAGL